jgi:putative hydrolase of the HAD superfamily
MIDKNLVRKYIKPLYPIPSGMKRCGRIKDRIKCIIFDVYGTLFISESGDIRRGEYSAEDILKIEDLLDRFNIRKDPEELLKDLFCAIQNEHAKSKDAGIDFPEIEINKIWFGILKNNDITMEQAILFAVEFELIVNPVYPMPHLKELIYSLKKLRIKTGIISNAQFYTPYLFEWFLESDLEGLCFDTDIIIFSYIFGCAKPSLSLFEIAEKNLRKKGIDPSYVLYVGNDMLNDIYPASIIGFKTALFAGDARSLRLRRNDSRCKHTSYDILVTDLIQLVNYIGLPE